MNQQEIIKLAVLLTKLLMALVLAVFGKYMKKGAKWAALGTSILTLALSIAYIPIIKAGLNVPFEIDYLPAMGINLSLNIDWLSFPFLLTEEFVTVFAMIYSLDYLKDKERSHTFYALLLLFSAGMSGTTMANDVFLFYFFWELMLIASTILLVNWGESEKRGATALKYFIITHLGSLLVLVAFVMIYAQSGVDHFTSLRAALQTMPDKLPLISSLFFIGFGVKMALVPFHIWLPDTHSEAPMPVTIMLAAAMLSMGTYGILRFPMSFLTMEQMTAFSLPLMIAGVVSEIYGASMAMVETDIKRIVAYSSVSQMGYILYGLGTMTNSGITGSTLHVIYHAIVKALLFCCVGWIIKATGKRDINSIRGLGKKMPLLTICTVLGALAIAGVPSLALFNSEWLIFSSGFQTPYLYLAILEVLGSLLTVVYILRFVGRCFFSPGEGEETAVKPVPLSMKVATVSLTGLTIIAGFIPKPLFDIVVNELPFILGGGL